MKIILTAQERQQLIKELQEGDQTMGKWWQLVTTVTDTGTINSFAAWNEALTLAQWQTNTGVTALQYINAQDSTSVVLGIPDLADLINDKTANAHNVDFNAGSRLANLGSTNGIIADVSTGFNSSVLSSLSGNSWSNPYILAYCFQISRAPTATETLYCHGSSSADVFAAISLTTNRYIEYSYKDDSGNTLTKTSSNAVPYDKKMLLIAFLERSKVRIFLHGDTFDHAIQITDEGAFNTTSTLNTQAVNCKYSNGSASQLRTNGYYFGHILAEAVSTKTYDIIDNCCNLFGVPFALQDISTLDNGLISLIQGPGAGGLTTTKADIVDLITGTVFTATGTQPAATTGKFHNAFGLGMTASTIYMQGTVPAIWDIYNGSYGDYTIYVRYKTGTINSAVRNIFCLNPTTTPNVNNVRLQLSAANVIQLIIDNTTVQVNSTVTLSSNTWYDIIIKKASGVHSLSVNAETPVTFTPTTRSTVGGYFGFGGHFTAATTILHAGAGHLDCLALWNRTLTSDEIIQLRKGGDGLDGMFNYLTQYDGGGGPPPTAVVEYRGPQIAATNNDAIPLTGTTTSGAGACYLSFKSPRSGRLKAVDFWWKSKSTGNYAAGTGGTYTLSVRTDNAGVPSSTVVAEVTGISGFDRASANGNTAADFRSHTLTPVTNNGQITAGTQYHLCVLNTHASPASNYMSVNGSGTYSGSRALNRPTMDNFTDFAFRLGNGFGGGPINSYTSGVTTGNTPNITFHVDTDASGTADFWFGCPWTDPRSGNSGAISVSFGGANWIRQKLPIESADSFTITAVSVALTRIGASTGVNYRILASNGTTVLASGVISEANYPQFPAPSSSSNPSWGRAVLSSPLAITGGNTYYLELYSTSGTYYPSVMNHQSPTYGSAAVAGANGVRGGWYGGINGILQRSTNSGATYGTYDSGKRCLAFYFDVTVP